MTYRIFILLLVLCGPLQAAKRPGCREPMLSLMVRKDPRFVDPEAIAAQIEEGKFSYTPLIRRFMGWHIRGFQDGTIHNATLHPGQLVNQWGIFPNLVQAYPEGLAVVESEGGDPQILGMDGFWDLYARDFEYAGGMVSPVWTEQRASNRHLPGRTAFMRRFLLELAFQHKLVDVDLSDPNLPHFTLVPYDENSLVHAHDQIREFFGDERFFIKAYSEFYFGRRGQRTPFIPHPRKKLPPITDGYGIPMDFPTPRGKPVIEAHASRSKLVGLVDSLLARVDTLGETDSSDLPMMIFVAESSFSDVDSPQLVVALNQVVKLGDIAPLVEMANKKAGRAVFTKPHELSWEQELLVEVAVHYLRSIGTRAELFNGFAVQEFDGSFPDSDPAFRMTWENFRDLWLNPGKAKHTYHTSVMMNRFIRERFRGIGP